MSSVRIANSYLSGALEVAEYIQNGVRRATNDCVLFLFFLFLFFFDEIIPRTQRL